ncbi:maleylpyruvate isomerase N-terminal domain-containing protein [Streptomyces goshikiensis]|uniref:maleylpyruvate isomerase N-terminal domain-containing protein n=1 Tax=Streptomyces goshikiensis TaxID=1942 RepID=UPI003721242A
MPTCPGRTLGDLTRHVGSEHRWFSELLRRRIQQPPTRFAHSALSDFNFLVRDWSGGRFRSGPEVTYWQCPLQATDFCPLEEPKLLG